MKIPRWYQKVESSEPLRILADKNLKLKFSTSNETLKGIGQTQCQTQCQLAFGAIIFVYVFFFFFFFKEELEVTTKLTLSVWGSAGVKAMTILFERWRGWRLLVSAIPEWEYFWWWCTHGWPHCEIMHCVQIRYIWNKYLIFFIFHLHRMSELFPQVFPLFEQQYERYVQCQLEFGAIDFEEKEIVNFERIIIVIAYY